MNFGSTVSILDNTCDLCQSDWYVVSTGVEGRFVGEKSNFLRRRSCYRCLCFVVFNPLVKVAPFRWLSLCTTPELASLVGRLLHYCSSDRRLTTFASRSRLFVKYSPGWLSAQSKARMRCNCNIVAREILLLDLPWAFHGRFLTCIEMWNLLSDEKVTAMGNWWEG